MTKAPGIQPALCIVIPCFNEAERLDSEKYLAFLRNHPEIDLIMIDDGSVDDTLALINKLKDTCPRQINTLPMGKNVGKGEAVRIGILTALTRRQYDAVGYFDADLSTPLPESLRMQQLLTDQQADVVMGSRISFLGTDIRRQASRHYLGRIFATFASMILRLPVYDTQCGAKLFRADIAQTLFAEPLHSRWFFDIEVLARYITLNGHHSAKRNIFELPLNSWKNVGNSKLKLADFVQAPIDLFRIWLRYPRLRTYLRQDA